MSDKSAIEWTDASWNPVTGCTKVSPGCAHCYAETLAERFRGVPGHPFEHGFDVQLRPDKLDLPLRWKKPRRIFVNSMSDLFHESVPDEYIGRVFAVMALTPWHVYQVLTKRPKRMLAYCTLLTSERLIDATNANAYGGEHQPGAYNLASIAYKTLRARHRLGERDPWKLAAPPLPNVWLGVSVENQHWADERILLLLQTPAAVRFLSCEPLLGPVDLRSMLPATLPALDRAVSGPRGECIDWVIVGGESGPKARPMDVEWARSIVRQCKAAGVPVFVKQLGARPVGLPALRQVRNGDHANRAIETWPEDLRVQEFPR